jgi:sulfur relay (sulfurtransferase) DsrF/TusC family protein|tara:strand:+ start:424 stop:1023 length:600 start_codon:yes stop_codon:yes gene_type:complete
MNTVVDDIDMDEPSNVIVDIDDMGTQDTCMFSDDEEVQEEGRKCPICAKSSGSSGDFMKHIRSMHDQLLGKLNRESIYDILLQCYEQDYRQAMLAGGAKVQALTRKQIKTHFQKHETSPMADVIYDLRTVQIVQEELRTKGMRSRHSISGVTTVDTSKVKLYLELSKQKMALHRTLKKIRNELPKNHQMQPHTFFKQEW